jgi:molecular chaperone DnaK (HSP70)
MSEKSKIVVGIDLGTTYSCIAAYIDGSVQVLSDFDGNPTVPSFVAFTDHGIQIGKIAKENFLIDPANRVYGKYFKLVTR